MMDELASRRTVYQIALPLMKWQPFSYLSVTNRDQYFVIMTATAENPVSQKYVVTKGRETFITSSDKVG
jgi:hypothetical protein